MNINFVIRAVEKQNFSKFVNLNDQELIAQQAKWIIADKEPGYPCRVSLLDAKVGERVLTLPYIHHHANSPYRASGPIFVRENSETARPKVNEVPKMLRHRLLSVRAYDSEKFMVGADVVQGTELELTIEKQFYNREIEYIHLHNAGPGCFICVVHRA